MATINKQQAQEIIDKYIGGIGSPELSKEYGIWTTSITNIIRGTTWKECKRPNNIQYYINIKHPGNKCKNLPNFTKLQEDIIIGSLLGDGSLHNLKTKRSNSRFSKLQMKEKKSYLDWHFENFSKYSSGIKPVMCKEKLYWEKGVMKRKSVKKHLSSYQFNTFSHPIFTELRHKWYPESIKIVPKDLALNPQRIAIWFFDDGSNSISHRMAVLCTNSFVIEDVEFLKDKLSEFDLFPKIVIQKSKFTGKDQPLLKFYNTSYDNLIALIKPYAIWECVKYKVEWQRGKRHWEVFGKVTPEQVKQIRELRKTKMAKELCKQFNLSRGTIYSIVSGNSWKHIM